MPSFGQELHEAGLEGLLGRGQADQEERGILAPLYRGLFIMADMAKHPSLAWDLVSQPLRHLCVFCKI